MGSRKPTVLPVLSAAVLALAIFSAPTARAQLVGTDTSPGASCAGFPVGAARFTASPAGNGSHISLICDGTIWKAASAGGGLWTVGTGDEIYYNSGSPEVGIGTTGPISILDLRSTGPNINLGDTDAAHDGNISAALVIRDSTNQVAGQLSYNNTTYLLLQNRIPNGDLKLDSMGDILIDTNNLERVRISSAGYVGIGDTNPSVALDVIGDVNYTGVIVDVSDIRLKENVRPLQNPLARLVRLQGFAFEMKNDPKHVTEYGLSAQDVQQSFPELVHQVDADGTLGVSYNGLIAPMIEAIKELKAENDALRARIDALEER